MAQNQNDLAKKIEAFNDRLCVRLKKNQEILDNMGAGAVCVDTIERLKAIFKIK
jgi:hypothetical protein